MHAHLPALVVFSALVALVLALLVRDEPRDQLRLGLFLFLALTSSALVLGRLLAWVQA
jgi:hypothetical protein